MDRFFIEATEMAPRIDLNPATGVLSITGESRPENVHMFYNGIIEWISQYMTQMVSEKNQNVITLNIKLDYFNSSSEKFIMKTLKTFCTFKDQLNIQVNWSYDEEDEDMLDAGQDMSVILNCPFNYLPVK